MNMMEFKHRSQSNQASSSGKQKQARFEQRHDLGGGEMTALQKHVAFFDRDGDGMISPLDTWRGMRDLGYGWTLSLLATFVVHLFLSWPSNDTWIPRTLNININNINRCRHGSDSQVYKNDGEINEEAFETMWKRHDPKGKGYIDTTDLLKMMYRQRDIYDPFGWAAISLEWGLLWVLAADANWRLSKDVVRGQYDGTLFEKISEREKKRRMSRRAV